MPKRTTEFQDLIELIERQLAPIGAKVTASKFLKDSRSGENREVDIFIETTSGIHPFTIGIEVIEHQRPASTPWIESIAKKHEDLPINKTIAVSRSGFYKPALLKAKAYNIDTLTVQEASDFDWKAKLDSLPGVKIESFLLPSLTSATIVFTDKTSITELSGINPESLELFTPAGKSRGTSKKILDGIIKDKEFIIQLEEKAFTDAGTIVDGELRFESGSFVLDNTGKKHGVNSIQFTMRCKKEIIDAELMKGRYRDIAVALASGSSFGHAVQMALTEQKDGKSPMLSFRIKKKRERQ